MRLWWKVSICWLTDRTAEGLPIRKSRRRSCFTAFDVCSTQVNQSSSSSSSSASTDSTNSQSETFETRIEQEEEENEANIYIYTTSQCTHHIVNIRLHTHTVCIAYIKKRDVRIVSYRVCLCTRRSQFFLWIINIMRAVGGGGSSSSSRVAMQYSTVYMRLWRSVGWHSNRVSTYRQK